MLWNHQSASMVLRKGIKVLILDYILIWALCWKAFSGALNLLERKLKYNLAGNISHCHSTSSSAGLGATLPPFLISPFFSSFLFSANPEYNPDPIFRPHRTFIMLKRKSGNACNCLIHLPEFYPDLFFACSAYLSAFAGRGGEVHHLSARVHQLQWNKQTGQAELFCIWEPGCKTRWGGLLIYWPTSTTDISATAEGLSQICNGEGSKCLWVPNLLPSHWYWDTQDCSCFFVCTCGEYQEINTNSVMILESEPPQQ